MDKKNPDAFRTIREVADWLGVPTHVLRFWESKFKQIAPVKGAGGRRYYRSEDIGLLGGIKELLHEQGVTIRGVQKMIEDSGPEAVIALSPPLEFEPEPGRPRRIIRNGETPPESAASISKHAGGGGGIYALDDLASRPEPPEPTDAPQDEAPPVEASPDEAPMAEAPMAEDVPPAPPPDNIVQLGGSKAPKPEVAPEAEAAPEVEAEVEAEVVPAPHPEPAPKAELVPEFAPESAPEIAAEIAPDVAAGSSVQAARTLLAAHRASGRRLAPTAQARLKMMTRRLKGLAARWSAEQDF